MGSLRFNHVADTTVLVVGPTLAAVAIALESAKMGHTTTLAMNTTSPAVEIGSSMGAWLTSEEIEHLPSDLRSVLLDNASESMDPGRQAVRLLDQNRAVTAAEDLLLDAGVALLYDIHPIGLLMAKEPPSSLGGLGVLFGGKCGAVAATASVVLDCTVDGRLAKNSGYGNWTDTKQECLYAACLLSSTDSFGETKDFASGVTVSRHGPFAEFRFTCVGESPELFLRRCIIDNLAGWNRLHEKDEIRIELAGDEILRQSRYRLTSDGVAGPESTGIERFYCIGPAADSSLRKTRYLDTRTRYVSAAVDAAPHILKSITKRQVASEYVLLQNSDAVVEAESTLSPERYDFSFHDRFFDEPGVGTVSVDLPSIPVVRQVELAVVGGGTSGAPAAWQAGLLGIETLCVEKHSDVGGVSTIGGVPAYWFGRRTPYFKGLHRAVKKVVKEREVTAAFGKLHLIEEAGTEMLLRTPTVGIASKGQRISHVLVVSGEGLQAISARFFIDATGDGDLAAWAGAPYSYGAIRDEITLWCSFGSFHRNRDTASRQYMSVVDQRSVRDTTRGIIAGRRMGGIFGKGRYVQHYLASRESRHIRCKETVTYHDVMMERAFADAVMCCKSNIDIKGMASSRAAMCGYIEKTFEQNYTASIPYGAIVPEAVQNLVVTGKAYSITHDALSMARMQPDMMCLGAVCAFVAHAALSQAGSDTSLIDIFALQTKLMEQGILLPGDLPHGPLDERIPPDDENLAEIIERLASEPMGSSE